MRKPQPKKIGVSNAELADAGMIDSYPDDIVGLVTFTPRQEEMLLKRDGREHLTRETKLRDAKLQVLENRKEVADSLQAQEVGDLRVRVGQIEHLLGPSGRTLIRTILDAAVGPIRKHVKAEGEILIEAMGQALGARAAELDERIDAIDAKPCMIYRGIFDVDVEYGRGDVVTDRGCLWVCIDKAKGSRPGKSVDFKQIAKAGAAERNAERNAE